MFTLEASNTIKGEILEWGYLIRLCEGIVRVEGRKGWVLDAILATGPS